jgi:MinD superfamily P-loop ATPase
MKIAVASGKGGTGKTTVSASLVSVWPKPVAAMDLDVEEPNLHLFLRPEINGRKKALMEIPEVDESKCNYCRECAEICQFKAISVFGSVIMTFPEMCHGCGGCLAVCPEKALSPGTRELGEVLWGQADNHLFLMGKLRVGEAMSPPLMRHTKNKLAELDGSSDCDLIIDAPPGVSCPAVNAVMDSDVILLVTEPTPFGLYDLKLAHEAFRPFGKPMAAIVNRAGIGNRDVYAYCQDSGLEIIAEIPYERQIAEMYSKGLVLAEASESLRAIFVTLAASIQALAEKAIRPEEVIHE